MLRFSLAIILLAAASWAKQPDKPVPQKPDKKAVISADGKRIVEKVKTRKGTNDVWTAGREFPLMFDNNRKAKQNGQGEKK